MPVSIRTASEVGHYCSSEMGEGGMAEMGAGEAAEPKEEEKVVR